MSIAYEKSNLILDKEFGAQTNTPETTYYVGLSLADSATIGADGLGFSEPSGGSYARVAVSNTGKTNWSVAGSGTLTNTNSITFPKSTANWGSVQAVCLFDASTAGTAYYFDDLTTPKAVNIGTTAFFSGGDIDISLSGSSAYSQSAKILDSEFGSTSYVAQGTYYLGLSTTPIASNGTGATEPTGGAYARIPIVNNKTSWTTAVSGSLSNAIAVSFVESTSSWGTITHAALFSALTGGSVLYYGTLSTSRIVTSETTVTFDVGGITVSIVN